VFELPAKYLSVKAYGFTDSRVRDWSEDTSQGDPC
jgi:hypothetical protein